jgi:acylphosphatase
MTSAPQRCHVFFSGRVQGVGFRYTTANIARGYDVSGFVRNCDDGRVELVAEGQKSELDAFLREIREQFFNHIRNEQGDNAPVTNEFTGFDIRH